MSWRELHQDECEQLLAETSLGRLAFTDLDAKLTVLPVNYHWDGHGILIRTGSGSKLATAAQRSAVAFEIDSGESAGSDSSWSVLVRGDADIMSDTSGASKLETVDLSGWIGKERPVFIRVDPAEVSGRALEAAAVQ